MKIKQFNGQTVYETKLEDIGYEVLDYVVETKKKYAIYDNNILIFSELHDEL